MSYNYISYLPPSSTSPRVGHLEFATSLITPLSFPSGTPLSSIHDVITLPASSPPVPSFSEPLSLSYVTLLAPLSDRAVLAVGKNFRAHAAEFHKSGYDTAGTSEVPADPVLFTKAASSITAPESGVPFTETLDYEGELAVILGRDLNHLSDLPSDGWDAIWGVTLVNDLTSRTLQKKHNQWFLGKSGNGMCPIGPVAVPLSVLPNGAKDLIVESRVNGDLRQSASVSGWLFGVHEVLAAILAAGVALKAGDLVTMGTPEGVGAAVDGKGFLAVGDTMEITVAGGALGVLRNTVISTPTSTPALIAAPKSNQHVELHPPAATGSPTSVVILVHGLGGSTTFWTPLLPSLTAPGRLIINYDLEGHGLSTTNPTSTVSISSYAADLAAVISAHCPPDITPSLVAHSMGTLIALTYAATHPTQHLILLGPPAIPLPAGPSAGARKRAGAVRSTGMFETAAAVSDAAVAPNCSLLARGYARTMLQANDPEGYAKGCCALADTAEGGTVVPIEGGNVKGNRVIVAGANDKVSTVETGRRIAEKLGAEVRVLEDCGHMMVLEDIVGTGEAVKSALV